MSQITLESIQAKQTELATMIQQLLQQPVGRAREIEVGACTIRLAPGEHYAGAVLDADGNHMHHLVLMAASPDDEQRWQDAMDWAEELAGRLPTRQELALLYANCKQHLKAVAHWSCETYEGSASSAWYCLFLNGSQYYDRKDDSLAAVAVRSV